MRLTSELAIQQQLNDRVTASSSAIYQQRWKYIQWTNIYINSSNSSNSIVTLLVMEDLEHGQLLVHIMAALGLFLEPLNSQGL